MGLFKTIAEKLEEKEKEYRKAETEVRDAIETYGAGSKEFQKAARRLDRRARSLNRLGRKVSKDIDRPVETKRDANTLKSEISEIKEAINDIHPALARNKINAMRLRETYQKETDPDKKYRMELTYESLISSQKILIDNLNKLLEKLNEKEKELGSVV